MIVRRIEVSGPEVRHGVRKTLVGGPCDRKLIFDVAGDKVHLDPKDHSEVFVSSGKGLFSLIDAPNVQT